MHTGGVNRASPGADLLILAALVFGAGGSASADKAADGVWDPRLQDLAGDDDPAVNRNYYKAFVKESGELESEAVHILKPLGDGGYRLHIDWRIHSDDLAGTEYSRLNADYATLHVKSVIPGQQSDYVIERRPRDLVFSGRFQGEPLEKTVEIDEKPFFTNPTIGLRGFALSDAEEAGYWMLRPDNLKVYKVKARREAVETVAVDGQPIKAVRVKWGLTGIKSLFFSRVYWFRVSDGLFVKAAEADGIVTVWTGEDP